MAIPVKPNRGGFLRPFGCAWFIREYLMGNSPYGSEAVDPLQGAPQADIFFQYKHALHRVTAEDRAIRHEEKLAKKENRAIDPENIEVLIKRHLEKLPYKSKGCRYHSVVVYFAMLQQLLWVEPSGIIEASEFQANYPPGKPRIYFRLTLKGKSAPDHLWANPRKALYSH